MTLEIGSIVEGKVVSITKFGAFIELPDGNTGLVHISEISSEYVKEVKDFLKKDDKVKIKIIGKNKKGKFDLSIKQAKIPEPSQEKYIPKKKFKSSNETEQKPAFSQTSSKKGSTGFEEKLAQFLKDSEERLLDLKKNTEAKRNKGRFNR
ncbi:MAG TPA: S1 RNA-binding domain-containing protein [Candidatus Eremiobacteraeota bacterium]|nr:S1 RNA-binding domain-containing protein [Candidatus Eremiobacteraeota bacterium]